MTVAASTLLGRPLWYELMTTDMKAAEAFYNAVVGWTSSPFEGALQPYSMFARTAQSPVAGVMTTPEGVNAPPFWAMYVGVPKLEEAAAHIRRTCRPTGRSTSACPTSMRRSSGSRRTAARF